MSDLMMINGDIDNTIFGDIAIVEAGDDLIQSAINNILCIYGEYQFNDTLGNMAYRRRNKISENNLRTIEKDCSNAILLNDDRVQSVESMVATRNNDVYGAIDIAFVLQDTLGNFYSSEITITI